MTQKTNPAHETEPPVHPTCTVFGGGFFPESHMDDERRNLPPSESRFAEFVKSLSALLSSKSA